MSDTNRIEDLLYEAIISGGQPELNPELLKSICDQVTTWKQQLPKDPKPEIKSPLNALHKYLDGVCYFANNLMKQ
jgi:hypothetical protein